MKNKNKEQKFLPEGYRYLDVGEPINKGDYYWNIEQSRWKKIVHLSPISNWVSEHIIRDENKLDQRKI